MSTQKRKTWPGRVYIGRDEHGKQQFWWVGRFPTKRQRDDAVAEARTTKPWVATPPQEMTCEQWTQRYLARYERLNKVTSHQTAVQALKPFRKEFGSRPIAAIDFVEAEDWANTVPAAGLSQVVAMFNYVKSKRAIDHNPFDGLGGGSRGRGRADDDPPTLKELERLRDACDALGDYAAQMRDLIDFAALTLMRPGELYELRHPDVDVAANRINVARRVYRGNVDVPKNGEPKTIALVPPARAILMRQPTAPGTTAWCSSASAASG
jgi:integrase